MPGPGNIVILDPDFGSEVVNSSGISTRDVFNAMTPTQRNLMTAMASWSGSAHGLGSPLRRAGSLFDRDRYVTPTNIFDQMTLAYDAVENDDVVAGVLESTESLAFARMSMHADDIDEQDIYNQIAADLDLDSRLREMWRELFTVSQFYVGVWWHTKEYKVSGKGRKKAVNVRCPKALTILDPLKVIPVGLPMFGQSKLAWVADRDEATAIDSGVPDEIMQRLILGKYTPTATDKKYLAEIGVAADRLYELNPANVFRHAATKPGYQQLAAVRMKSIFKYLDMKHQLQSMDRTHLIGATNFIVLITQGSDKNPAKPEEIAHLQASVRTVAQTPVLVGDHRLDVKIVTPNTDSTLSPERYDTIDIRITSRLYQMFVRSSGAERSDNSEKLMKVVASGMESRRKMLRRTLEKHIFTPMFEQNDGLKTPPRLQFHPARIALEFDDALASFMMELRNSREISRHTLLSQFEFSQEFEADMLEREDDLYDDIFKTINPNNQGQPGSGVGPDGKPQDPALIKKKQIDEGRSGGRQGGTKKGGGAAPGTRQGKTPLKPAAQEESDDDQD